MLLQIVKMSDEVTVSSLPHPISMFFLGIFAVAIVFMWVEVQRSSKRKEKVTNDLEVLKSQMSDFKNEIDVRFSDLSKKIDSRVDKALISIKKG